jgi:hypothetical protein
MNPEALLHPNRACAFTNCSYSARHARAVSQVPQTPRKPIRTLQDAADDAQIIVVRCGLCRRLINYLATDLVQVLNPSRPVDAPPFACSRCGTADYMSVRVKNTFLGGLWAPHHQTALAH